MNCLISKKSNLRVTKLFYKKNRYFQLTFNQVKKNKKPNLGKK